MLTKKLMFPVDDHKGKLSEFSTHESYHYQDKKEAKLDLKEGIKKLSSLQDKLFAYDKYAVLIVLQAMDAAGKDGTIKHVMSGINPQGCRVVSFKAPSAEELDHDFLWRCNKQLPSRGKITKRCLLPGYTKVSSGIRNYLLFRKILMRQVSGKSDAKISTILNSIWRVTEPLS